MELSQVNDALNDSIYLRGELIAMSYEPLRLCKPGSLLRAEQQHV